jgi:hypothetical protein
MTVHLTRLCRDVQALEDLVAHYDYTVRNSVGGIVQFEYGDDRLDPAELEGEAAPVAFPRTWSHALVSKDGSVEPESKNMLMYRIIRPSLVEKVSLSCRTKLENWPRTSWGAYIGSRYRLQ